MKRLVVLGTVLTLAGGASLHAQGAPGTLTPDQFVAVRKAVMDLQGGVMGAMKAAVDSKADVKPFVPGAKGLVASSHVIPMLFPAGTEKVGNTKAKPEIWSDQAGFTKAAAELTDTAQKLVQLADANDKDGFAAQFAVVGKACGSCHRTFREKMDP